MGLKDFFRKERPQDAAARRLYETAVARARTESFYSERQVPDSIDGRFELISLHVYLLLRRLKRDAGSGQREVAQALYDIMFADMDRSLREMGVGDLGVGKRVKKMAQALSGRIEAYDAGMAAEEEGALKEALRRNLFGTLEGVGEENLAYFAAYLRRQDGHLAAQDEADALSGALSFGAVSGEA